MCLAKLQKFGDAKIFQFNGNRQIQRFKGWVGDEKSSALCQYLSRTMRNTTLWYMGQRKAQTRLWICAVPQGHLLLLRFLVVIEPDHVKQKYFLEIIIRSEKIYNLSSQVKKVARVSKQYILYYLSMCNKDADGQHDLRLCCSHRL